MVRRLETVGGISLGAGGGEENAGGVAGEIGGAVSMPEAGASEAIGDGVTGGAGESPGDWEGEGLGNGEEESLGDGGDVMGGAESTNRSATVAKRQTMVTKAHMRISFFLVKGIFSPGSNSEN